MVRRSRPGWSYVGSKETVRVVAVSCATAAKGRAKRESIENFILACVDRRCSSLVEEKRVYRS